MENHVRRIEDNKPTGKVGKAKNRKKEIKVEQELSRKRFAKQMALQRKAEEEHSARKQEELEAEERLRQKLDKRKTPEEREWEMQIEKKMEEERKKAMADQKERQERYRQKTLSAEAAEKKRQEDHEASLRRRRISMDSWDLYPMEKSTDSYLRDERKTRQQRKRLQRKTEDLAARDKRKDLYHINKAQEKAKVAAVLDQLKREEAEKAAAKQYQRRLDKIIDEKIKKKQKQAEVSKAGVQKKAGGRRSGWGWSRLPLFAKR